MEVHHCYLGHLIPQIYVLNLIILMTLITLIKYMFVTQIPPLPLPRQLPLLPQICLHLPPPPLNLAWSQELEIIIEIEEFTSIMRIFFNSNIKEQSLFCDDLISPLFSFSDSLIWLTLPFYKSERRHVLFLFLHYKNNF